jgi:purine-nucleoside phosphorylase
MASDPSFDPQAIEQAVARVRELAGIGNDDVYRVGLVMGTGLGRLADELEVHASVPYEDIPHMPVSTVESHAGRLLLGTLEGVPTVAMQGRFHGYEGYSMAQVTFPIRVMRALGAEVLIVSGATGGMNPLWAPGELVLLDDHINLLGVNPLVGRNLDTFGPRFPDMSEPYDRELQERALEAARDRGITLRRGVYAAVLGPNLETRAEYRMLRAIGADVVGMSTVPEVIVARHMDMRVMGITIITDQCLPDALQPADIPTIIKTATDAEPRLARIVQDVVRTL